MSDWLYFPDYSAANPYQSLLADALAPRWHARPGSIANALDLTSAAPVFHLHWQDAVYAAARTDPEACALAAAFLAECTAFRAAGGRLVWTMHNETPHENRFPTADLGLRHELARIADLVHVHGATGAAIAEALGARRILRAAHPSLHDAYPDDITDEAARRYWRIPPGDTVFAFFGALRGYKGTDTLVPAFTLLHQAEPATTLLLAGRGGGEHPARWRIPAPGIRVASRHLDDAVVQYVFHAADFVVLPYRRILTSGAAMLALGFARPVIAPALPGLLDALTPGRTMLAYDPEDPAGLAGALAAAHALPAASRATLNAHALAAAQALPPQRLADALSAAIAAPGLAVAS